jgi:hypothetical protein
MEPAAARLFVASNGCHPAKPSTVTNSRRLTSNVGLALLLLALENRDVGRKQCELQDWSFPFRCVRASDWRRQSVQKSAP